MAKISPSLAYFLRRRKTRPGGLLAGGGVVFEPAIPANTVLPAISGTAQEGQTLTASSGSWSGYPTPTYAYQWKKGGVNISGATSTTYVPVTGDVGSTITVTVTATNASGSASATSAATAAVSAAPDVTAPTLSSPTGTQTGQTTATIGVTTNEANGTLYSFVSTSSTPPSATNLKAGTGAVFANSQTITTTGAKTASATGLTASTAYYAHWLHRDAAGNDSAISTSASFTTAAAVALLDGSESDGFQKLQGTGSTVGNMAMVDVTRTASATTAPDGTTTAALFTEAVTGGSNRHIAYSQEGGAANKTFTFSIYAKPNNRRYLALHNGNFGVLFDLQTGTSIDTQQVTTQSAITPTCQAAVNGFYKCTLQFFDSALPSAFWVVSLSDRAVFAGSQNSNNIAYAGDGTSGVYLWRVKLVET